LLADAARADVKVVLSGEGADELFGGYPTYLGHKVAGLVRRLPGRSLLKRVLTMIPASTGRVTMEFLVKQLVAAAELEPVARHLTWFGALGPDRTILEWARGALDGFPSQPSLNRLLWLDFQSYLPDNLLVKVDRGTMLASIEARAPYLDRAVLELALPAAAQLKVRGVTTKAILKAAARGIVPEPVIRRRKRGLSVPVARWLNEGLADVANRHLARSRLFPDAPTAQLLAEHRGGSANHARKLWPLLMAELWAERWNVEP
jgi:asparagine synthase (glutamine-hydrolysing)